MAAGAELDEGEGEQAETEASGDAEGQRSGDQGEEGGKCFAEIVPADASDGAAHKRTNEDERRGGGVGRDRGDERSTKHGDEEERRDDNVAEAGASAGGDSGGAFDVAGDGGSSGEGAEHGAEGVRDQRAAGPREFAVAQETAFFADADQSSDVVEEIDKEKDEDEFTKADACGGAEVQLEERAGGMRQGEKMRGPLTEAERNSRESDDHDAEENGAGDAARHQDGHENKSGGGEKDLWVGSLAQADEGGRVGDDDFCVTQADEGDEEADACRGAVLEAIGNAVDDLFAHFGEREKEKEEAGEKDDAEGGLPGHAAAQDDGVGEVGVERHAGREGDGKVGPQSHDERGDCRGNAGGEENAFDRHAGFGEDSRVDDDYVSHGHEGGEAGEQFAAHGGVIFFETKDAVEQTVFPLK